MLIEKLRHQVAGQKAWRYGSTSEQTKQLMLALETSEIAEAAMTAKMKLPPDEPKDKPKRRPIPDHIPRNNIELLPPKDHCKCGGALRRIGEDITEELEYVPGRFVVNRIARPRYACKRCERFTQAPLPSRPIERGRPGPGLLAHVLVSKYADHLPLYRQSQIFEREGLDLDRSTLADWVGKTTTLLSLLADAIGNHVLKGKAIFTDDTPVNMLAPGTGKTQTGRLWVYARDESPWGSTMPPAAWCQFSPDRRGAHPKDHLNKYKGWMHADGYAGTRNSTAITASRKWPAWPISGASSSMCIARKAPPSPKRPSCASANSTPSRRKHAVHRQTNGRRYERQRPNRSSMTCRTG